MGVLLMLMTAGVILAALILLIASLVARKAWLAKFTLGGTAVWLGFYAAMLIGVSLMSNDNFLSVNEPKAYCGFYIDCHMHSVVTGVRTVKNIGDQTAKGLYYIVNVKIYSDAKNPDISLRLLEPKAVVKDAQDIRYQRSIGAEDLLPTGRVYLGADVRSNEAVEKELVFDLPVDVREPRLDMREGWGVDNFIEAVLIGDEDSIFHKRNYFKIQEQTAALGVN